MPHERRHVWDRDEVLAVYEDWRRIADAYDPPRLLVGEVFLYRRNGSRSTSRPARLHQAFDFSLMRCAFDAAELGTVVREALSRFPVPTWVLSNHDLVRHATRYGGGGLGVRRALAVTALVLALPGVPYLYQGEELGLEDTDVPPDQRQDPSGGAAAVRTPGRDGCRAPVPWEAAGPGHGFTTGTPWLPFGADAADVAVDRDPPVLRAYRELLGLRRALRGELGREVVDVPAPEGVLALRREGGLVVVLNTLGEDVEVACGPGELLTATAPGARLDGEVVTVPAAATAWVRAAR